MNTTQIHTFLLTATFSALTGILMLSNTPVLAQGSTASGGGLEEIVVTARRREESLIDTPVSITVFSAQDLQDRQIYRSHQIGESTPNLVYRNNTMSSSIASVIYIRGIGQGDFIPSVQPGVGIYVDEAYVATSIGSISEILDLESIEVLRGPQGTLFGRNTIGGAILLNTKKPNDQFGGEVEIAVGERDYKQAKAIINFPITDNFFGKIAAMVREKDGWVDAPNIEGDNGLGSEEVKAIRGALRWQTDNLTVDAYVDHSNRKSDGYPNVVLAYNENPQQFTQVSNWNNNLVPTLNAIYGLGLGPITNALYAPPEESYVNYAGDYLPSDADVTSTGLTITWDINDRLQFKSITNYRKLETIDGQDTDYTPEFVMNLTDLMDGSQFTQEFQLSGIAFDDRLNWMVGLYHFEEDTLNPNPVIFTTFGGVSGSLVQNNSDAAFGQLTYDLTDQLALTLGARYTDERLDSVVDDSIQYVTFVPVPPCGGPCATQPPPSDFGGYDIYARRGNIPGWLPFANPPNPGAFNIMANRTFEADTDDIEPYVNLAYNWNESLMTYVSYAEGFKGGGFTQRIPPGRVVETFFPEKAKVYELGLKYQSQDARFRLTGAMFYTDYTDLQVVVSTLLGTGLQNAADAEIKGFELEAVGALGENFVLSAGVGYLDPTYSSVSPEVNFSADNRMPSTPEWQFNISGVYTTQIGDGTLRARLDYSYSDEYFTGGTNQIINPSFDVVNGFIGYTTGDGNWEFALQARNLLDDWYTENRGGNFQANGTFSNVPNPPREVIFRVKYMFSEG